MSYPTVYTREGFVEVLSSEFDVEADYIAAERGVNAWLARGDGVAVYENQDLGHSQLGHKKFASYGSDAAQLVTSVGPHGQLATPPSTLPDIGNEINWRYVLVGIYRGEQL